jgi:two-component system sensor kinase
LVAKLYSRLAYAYWFARGATPTLWAHLRELNLAERYPPSRELGQAYANHSAVMTMLPYFKRGIAYAERGRAIRERLGDLWGVGQSLHFHGLLLLAAARNSDALAVLQESTRRLERTGDVWELNNALFNVAYCHYRLGDLSTAVQLGRRVLESGREIGNVRDLGIGLEIWAKASGGHVPRDLLQAELLRASDDIHTVVTLMQAEAACLIAGRRSCEAATILADAQSRVKQSGLRNEYVASIASWWTTALRSAAEEASIYDCTSRRVVLRKARRAARLAYRRARSYRNNLPHILREIGLLAAMQGESGKARKCLDESLMVAQRQGARFEYAQTLLVRGRAGLELEWPGAALDVEEATKSLRALGAYWVLGEEGPEGQADTVTPGLVDRFDTVLEVGRRIATALSREVVYDAIREAAVTLLRGDGCLVLDILGPATDERRVRVVSRGTGGGQASDFGYSRTVVHRAIETGRPVVAGNGAGHDASESLVLSDARSILCAPIAVRGRTVACAYVTHRQVGGLFGPDEERLAEFVATLAGAALENVEGLAKTESQLIANSTAGLAHAIKNPVAVIRAYVDLLRTSIGRGDSSAITRYLHTMDGALDRIDELVRRLQRVPIDGGQKAPVAIEPLIRRAVDEVRPLFPDAGGFKVDINVSPGTPPVVMADGEQVVLVLTNLLANAGQSMPQGGLIRVDVGAGEDGAAAIAVSDQGPGVPPSVQPRLFQPFITTKPEGTGLGLWVCRKIVEEHHQGRITMVAGPEGGTTVFFTLPIGDPAGHSDRSDTSSDRGT